jgi:hypothetical protein
VNNTAGILLAAIPVVIAVTLAARFDKDKESE